MRSLRTRLLLGLLAGVFFSQVAIYLLIYSRIEDEIDDLFDAELQRSALSANANGPPATTPLPDRKIENPQQDMIVSTYFESVSDSGPRPDPLLGVVRSIPTGFSKRMLDGRQWRLFAVGGGSKRTIAAQPADIRDIAARKITLRALGPSLAVLPLLALMIWTAVFYGLQPLARITRALRGRSQRDLSAIEVMGLPPDLKPVASALNELMHAVSETIKMQRTFIADASHELLTPLTAMKLQGQMLARAKTPERVRETMAELQDGISRTLQLAQGLLTLARQDSVADLRRAEVFNLAGAVRNSLSIHMPLAEEKRLQLDTGHFDEVLVRGDAEAIAILSSTLIDNAVKYTDRAGRVRIGIHALPRAELRVEDSGPGIPVEDRERVFDRFYRRRDARAGGSGLGLAIARQIAARCHANIVLGCSEELGGLKVSVYFAQLCA